MNELAIWIPARLGSSRLPNKLLRHVAGLPLLSFTIAAAQRAADELGADVAVVTDSPELEAVAKASGVPCWVVTEPCLNGTERLARALLALDPERRPRTVVNLQGDEPLVPPRAIVRLVERARAAESRFATLMLPLEHDRGVSVLTDARGRALYFSRAQLPGRHPTAPPTSGDDLAAHVGRHVGLYLYSAELLASWLDLQPSPFELVEGLEQLRALHHGVPTDVFAWPGIDGEADNGHHLPWFGVDTADDLNRLHHLLSEPSATDGATRE